MATPKTEGDNPMNDNAQHTQMLAVLREAEAALGENLVYITDALDLRVRQKDEEALRKIRQLTDAWVAIVRVIAKAEGRD